MKKQIGLFASLAASPTEMNTSVRLCVRLVVLYNSCSCIDREKVLLSGEKETASDFKASTALEIVCFMRSPVLMFLRNT